VPNAGDNTISLLRGNPDGTFKAPVTIEAGAGPINAVVADFNRDGINDIAASTVSGVSIILGEGHGHLGPPLMLPAGTNPGNIIAADFNGDRKLDLAVANFGSNDVSVFLGKGDGTFAPARAFAAGMGPLGIAATDLNGDGHADLVVSNSGFGPTNGPNGNTIAILLGTGRGTFHPAVFLPMNNNPEGLAVGDFNKDGKEDVVVVLNSTDQFAELLGNGNGTFQPARIFSVFPQSPPEPMTGFGPVNVELADFNGDGNMDLAVVNDLTSTVAVILSDGTGNFKPPRNIEVSRTPVGVVTGDYNHDGKADFISSNFDAETVSVVLGNGNGTFFEARPALSGAEPVKMVTADFNNDGVPDVAVIGGFGTGPFNSLSVLLGKRDGGFEPKSVITLNGSVVDLVAADINQDGHIDLLGADFGKPGSNPGGVTVLLGNGDGSFQPPETVTAGTNHFAIAVSDFNEDGKPDVVVSNRHFGNPIVDSFLLLPGDGKGGFGTPSQIITFPGSDLIRSLQVGDFNRDGKMDIAYVTENIDITLFIQLGNGNGTFQPPKALTSVTFATDIFTFSIGDFNNDGNPDFAVEEGGVIETLIGDGKGNFVSKGKFLDNGFSGVAALVLADYNGDGLLDVASVNAFTDNVTVLFGNGNGSLSGPTLIFGGGSATSAVAADFNGDGRPDIALATIVPTASPKSRGEVIPLINTTPR
jgi:hypothetical protein